MATKIRPETVYSASFIINFQQRKDNEITG